MLEARNDSEGPNLILKDLGRAFSVLTAQVAILVRQQPDKPLVKEIIEVKNIDMQDTLLELSLTGSVQLLLLCPRFDQRVSTPF